MESSYSLCLEEDGACDCEMVDQGTLRGDPIITSNLSQKLQQQQKNAKKASSGTGEMCPKILGGYE